MVKLKTADAGGEDLYIVKARLWSSKLFIYAIADVIFNPFDPD